MAIPFLSISSERDIRRPRWCAAAFPLRKDRLEVAGRDEVMVEVHGALPAACGGCGLHGRRERPAHGHAYRYAKRIRDESSSRAR